jgi:hypothetical protein
MARVEKQVGTVQSTLKLVNSKTCTINRRLRGVETLDSHAALSAADDGLPSSAKATDGAVADAEV